MAAEELDGLLQNYRRYSILGSISSLLGWDTETLLPTQSIALRGDQSAELTQILHRELTRPELKDQILRLSEKSWPGVANRQLHLVRKEVFRAQAFDEAFVGACTRAEIECQNAWKGARASADFAKVAPAFGRLIALSKEKAERLRAHPVLKEELGSLTLFEVHMDTFEPGFKAKDVRRLFGEMRRGLIELFPKILEKQKGQPPARKFPMPQEKQLEMAKTVSRAMGFDFNRGRLDLSIHPFCSGHPDDTRMTTKVKPDDLGECLYSVIHESGHGIYEQSLPPELRFTPAGNAASLGIHESQSRFWENQIGRSMAFCRYLEPLTGVPATDFYRQQNEVKRGFIRIEADEVSYNLHILLRMQLEEEIFSGQLDVKDIPARWNEEFAKLFSVKVPSDAQGCLQDIHWYGGTFGYFPTYSIGNLLAAELFHDLQQEQPDWAHAVEKGQLGDIKAFLSRRVHSQAALQDSPETIRQALKGRELGTEAFLNYIETKYLGRT